MERTPEAQWVKARLDAVAPAWTPNIAQARRRLAAAPSRPWVRTRPVAVASALALLGTLSLTAPVRTAAQELWYRFTVSRIDVVRLDFSDVPLDTSLRTDGAQTAVSGIEEASARAGFLAVLPSSDLLAEVPTLTVTSRIDVTQRLHTGDLRAALERVGATDLEVPDSWQGVQLHAMIGPLVIAEYSGDVSIVQAPPIQLQVPAGIDLARVAEVVFRAAGSSWWEARLLGEAYARSPAWLLDVPEDDRALVEALSLPDGSPVVVVDGYADDGGRRSTVLVSGVKRMVAVSSPSRATSVLVAQAISH